MEEPRGPLGSQTSFPRATPRVAARVSFIAREDTLGTNIFGPAGTGISRPPVVLYRTNPE